MIIQYASDLHLEFELNRDFILAGGMAVSGDVLLLAGDIGYLKDPSEFDPFWDWCEKNYRETIVVPGNHEFYEKCDANALRSFKMMLRPHVSYYHNQIVHLDDADIICSTLWSHITPKAEAALTQVMPDFRQIRFGYRRLRCSDVNKLHDECVKFIFDAIRQSQAKTTIIATHHLPSWAVVVDCYKESPLTEGFATELKALIEENGPDYWVYGHSHANIETMIGKTKLLSNQLGYLKFDEHLDFDDTRTIEI